MPKENNVYWFIKENPPIIITLFRVKMKGGIPIDSERYKDSNSVE
jgi:hypothetical protein